PDEAAASDLVELKAEFPASFAVTWYRFTDIGLEPSKEPIAATEPVSSSLLTPTCSGSATTCCSGRAAGAALATRMNLLGGRVTFGYFFMCHGVDLAAKRMGYYVYQIIPARESGRRPRFPSWTISSPRCPEFESSEPASDFVQRVYLNVSGDTVAEDSAASGWAPLPTAVWKTPAESPLAADGSLSNSRLSWSPVSAECAWREGLGTWPPSAPKASAQLHLLVSTPPLLSKVNQTIAANESSVLFIDCLQPGDSVSPPPATEFSWYRAWTPACGNPSLVATSGTAAGRIPPACTLRTARLIIPQPVRDDVPANTSAWPSPACPSRAPFWSSRTKSSPGTPPLGTVRLRVIPAAALSQSGHNGHVDRLPLSPAWSSQHRLVRACTRTVAGGGCPPRWAFELSKKQHQADQSTCQIPEFSGSWWAARRCSTSISPNRTVDPRRLRVVAALAAPRKAPAAAVSPGTLRGPAVERGVIYDRTNSRPVARAPARGSCCFENGSLLITDVARWTPETYATAWLATPFRVA
uniref:Ig-like domain-containing protein n=1 Tax=Macrostomum lignano TaxID=282301 RepID=A0A1I8F5B2_9PLAT